MSNENRTATFKRNMTLEDLLGQLNNTLEPVENVVAQHYESKPSFPLVFIMGPHRCGSTLFMQWLARTKSVSYPTNLLSRFYKAPLIGAQIQLLLTDERFNFRNEILDFNSDISFQSENGKTQGALAPNEFWYFWRRFLPFEDIDWLSNERLHKILEKSVFCNELRGLTQIFEKPFVLKSMILNYNIPLLYSLFPEALFVQLKRDSIANIASMLAARKRQLGSEEEWYSFKIPEYELLKDMKPVQQCAGQLYFINKAIDEGMRHLPDENKMLVDYKDFCKRPASFYQELVAKLKVENPEPYSGSERFNSTRNDMQDIEILSALNSFEEKYG